MRLAVLFSLCLACAAVAAPPKSTDLDHFSSLRTPAVPMAEVPKGVVVFHLKGTLEDKGKLTLTLDPAARGFAEDGEPTPAGEGKTKEIEVTAAFVKELKVRLRPANPLRFAQRNLYKLEGKSLKTRLTLLGPADDKGAVRLMVHDKAGKVAHAMEMDFKDITPCHPGCFPAGTLVLTHKGTRPVESIRVGDEVTTVDPEGRAGSGKVGSIFVTKNKLLKIETDGGTLFTTPTQPLSRADGRIVPAEELKVGDRIHRWQAGKRIEVKVKSVTDSGRVEKVFNLVLGDGVVFVANGFLARGKPPAE